MKASTQASLIHDAVTPALHRDNKEFMAFFNSVKLCFENFKVTLNSSDLFYQIHFEGKVGLEYV